MRLLHVLPLVRERLAPGSVYYAPPLASEDFEYEAHAVRPARAAATAPRGRAHRRRARPQADAAQAHIERMYLPVAARFAAADCRLDVVKAGSQGVAPVRPRQALRGAARRRRARALTPLRAQALCRRAEELQAAVLVLHNHRRTALQTALLGSVSTFCAMHCARPVLLVH